MKFSSEKPKVVVVGSSSVDIILNAGRIPNGDETVLASSSESFFGGKGANQAVAASRLGCSVYFVGCVGMDPLGQQILRNLTSEGVNVGFVKESEEAETGSAYVTAAGGKNAIVVVPAANSMLKPQDIHNAEKYIHTADIVLVQLEIPMETILETVRMAKKYNKKIGIYAAPGCALSQEIIDNATFIVVKHAEISTVFNDEDEDVLTKYPNKVFVRADDNTTVYHNGNAIVEVPKNSEKIPHKMGMGDGFTAGFAVALCYGNPVEDCVNFGNLVSHFVAGERGSQKGLPNLKTIMSLI